jgi:hypothetical protein
MNTENQNRSQETAQTRELVGVDVPRLVRHLCAYCGAEIPRTNIFRICIPCQRKEMKWTGDPKNFEGDRWHWHATRYVPIQMCYGTIQSDHMAYTAKLAWKTFEKATRRTREELKRQGYRVKRVTITPAWTSDSPTNAKEHAPSPAGASVETGVKP